ncbi:MAG: GNAT family N-acetyltransferase [Bacteroidota bacterium]
MIHYQIATPKDWKTIARTHAHSWQLSYRGILSDQYLDHEVEADRYQVWEKRFQQIAKNQYAVLAMDGPQCCGFSCVFDQHHPEWGALLDNLHVLPSWRGQGIGAKLLLAGAKWIHHRHPNSLYYLWVYEDNALARNFYSKMGGQEKETILDRQPDGVDARIVRYVWEDLGKLIGNNKQK